MDICEKYLADARKALKGSMFSKPDQSEAVRSYEGAAQCFENFRRFDRAAQCYIDTANLVMQMDPLKAAEMLEKAALCMKKVGSPAGEYHLQAAAIYKEHAITRFKANPDQGLQLLQKAAESYEKGGDRASATQCYEVGAKASLKRKDYLNALVFYGTAAQNLERNKEYRDAIKYFHKVAKLWDVQNVPENVAENYGRMAVSLEALEEHEYASQFFTEAAKKYEEAQEIYKSAKSYEKSADILRSIEKYMEAAASYSKAAALIKTLKNMDKYEELYANAAECYVKAGELQKGIETSLLLAETFSDDPTRYSKHFEEAISFAESNTQLKIDLLMKQGGALVQMRDYLKGAQSYQEAAELLETVGESPVEPYKKAGDAYVLYAKAMQKVKNKPRTKKGFENAVSCFEKAGLSEEAEKIHQTLKPETGQREKQILEELIRLKADYEKGALPITYYQQIKEGYEELLKRLKQ